MKRKRPTRGMGMIALIMMLVMLGSTVSVMTLLFTAQARRTRAAVAGMQVRQLLLAGEMAARAALMARGTLVTDVNVTVPADAGTLTVTLRPRGGNGLNASASVAAEYHGVRGRQEIAFVQRGSQWEVLSASLEQAP